MHVSRSVNEVVCRQVGQVGLCCKEGANINIQLEMQIIDMFVFISVQVSKQAC
jgi:hypothetical protein